MKLILPFALYSYPDRGHLKDSWFVNSCGSAPYVLPKSFAAYNSDHNIHIYEVCQLQGEMEFIVETQRDLG